MKSPEEDPIDKQSEESKGRSRLSRFFSHILVKCALLVWFAVAVFQQCYPLYQTRSYEIGTLALPGSGEINYSLKMPVNGGLTVSLANVGEDGRAVVFRDGVRANGEDCRLRVPEPEGGFKRFLENSEDPEVRTQRARFHRALVSCRSFEYYGVVRFMLFDDRTGELLGVKYNPSGQQGASVARFGNIAKGALVRVEIKAYDSVYLKDRRRLLNKVFVKPYVNSVPGKFP